MKASPLKDLTPLQQKRVYDYLKANGVVVSHILSATKTEPHPYTSAARIVDGELSYRGLF